MRHTVPRSVLTDMKPMRLPPRLAFWALAAATLLISHDLVWLVQSGPGESLATALRSAQHGYWTWVSIAILIGVCAAAIVTVLRTLGLLRLAHRLDAPVARARARSFLARAAVAWLRLLAVVGIGFAIQENVEHYLAHGHVLGLGAVTGPEYPLAIPVLAAATVLAALVGATVRSIEREILAGIAGALRSRQARAPRRLRPIDVPVPLRRRPAMAGTDAGRAPPLLLVGT